MGRHPIAADYVSGETAISERFDYQSPYRSGDVWRERAADVAATSASALIDREAAAEAVLAYNRRTNPIPEAIAAAERLKRPDALVVVGGQQAGLFTGPMLVVYKAITIIRTARTAEAKLGRPVVPVFWIAGEDHDWDEANHTYVLSPQLELKKPIVPHPDAARRTSVSRTSLPAEAWAEALEQLSSALPDTEFKPVLMERLRAISDASTTLSDAFARTMSLLFGRFGLVLIDADDSGLRAVEGPAFQALVQRRDELSAALKEGERAVAAAGYPLQAESAEDGYNLFVFRDGERKLLFRDGTDAVDRKGTLRLSAAALERLAEEAPAAFSNNALTRPMMQEQLFPVLATVLGPSEIAYWSTLREAFRLFGLRTPIVVPRLEFTLLEGTVQKQMDKFGLSFADAWERLEERKEAWLAGQDELGLSKRFADVKETFVDLYRPLVDAAASINPGLRKLGDTNMGKIVEQIDFLESRSIDAMKQQHEAGLRHWERIRWTVAPNGKPQERIYNVFQYANRYGIEWVGELLEKIELDFAAPYRPHDAIYL
ncbi:bacillithiol biosynthesis cysteine-adding enzyme BshC [Paenibacillus sp. TRM 82003]|nr:bacillithiol biosynthesis cysteine-adding enzyme BshC [Paenibacillus sp. TRM 82003]